MSEHWNRPDGMRERDELRSRVESAEQDATLLRHDIFPLRAEAQAARAEVERLRRERDEARAELDKARRSDCEAEFRWSCQKFRAERAEAEVAKLRAALDEQHGTGRAGGRHAPAISVERRESKP